jgi:hypothetical protein
MGTESSRRFERVRACEGGCGGRNEDVGMTVSREAGHVGEGVVDRKGGGELDQDGTGSSAIVV